MKNIGKRIEKARVYRHMSRTELGIAVGFPEASAYRRVLSYEKRERVPKDDMLKEFAKALKIDFDWFKFDDNVQIDNVSYFEYGADSSIKKYIKLRVRIEKDIYDNLQRLQMEELGAVIDIIEKHRNCSKSGICGNNSALYKSQDKINRLISTLRAMAEEQ